MRRDRSALRGGTTDHFWWQHQPFPVEPVRSPYDHVNQQNLAALAEVPLLADLRLDSQANQITWQDRKRIRPSLCPNLQARTRARAIGRTARTIVDFLCDLQNPAIRGKIPLHLINKVAKNLEVMIYSLDRCGLMQALHVFEPGVSRQERIRESTMDKLQFVYVRDASPEAMRHHVLGRAERYLAEIRLTFRRTNHAI